MVGPGRASAAPNRWSAPVTLHASPQQRRRINATPRGGPIGSEVTVVVTDLPPMIGIQIGFGNLQQHQILERTASDGFGLATVTIRVPEMADVNRTHFFFVAFDDAQPRGVSEPFHVTAADGTAIVRGQIADDGRSCTALRTAMDELYTLVGDTSAFKPGTRVAVRGKIVDGAACGNEGITIGISEIRAAL
jgi:hypothetical protein